MQYTFYHPIINSTCKQQQLFSCSSGIGFSSPGLQNWCNVDASASQITAARFGREIPQIITLVYNVVYNVVSQILFTILSVAATSLAGVKTIEF